jgi:hypothetical protein
MSQARAKYVKLELPTEAELREVMAATDDIPPSGNWGGFTATREANGFPRYARAVLDLLEARSLPCAKIDRRMFLDG